MERLIISPSSIESRFRSSWVRRSRVSAAARGLMHQIAPRFAPSLVWVTADEPSPRPVPQDYSRSTPSSGL